ncbi:GAF domain-containing protein [Cryobacterium fucosi]|uniref:GAF domain-containing protein n=1 Tax=Cryobacterium fucosi TaxID=1259157 RepID=A0A4R9BF93_9MICO|nr:GAF domain-containing protein [Cryobacterium fucosi]TFD82806.1 GAF domain-containing protein [Cryobacterium fucosi]
MPPEPILGTVTGRIPRTSATESEVRLRSLLQASQSVVEQLELSSVLRRIVDVAVELVGARYGALGVIAPNGGLEQFIHVGMPDGLAERIGHLPVGLGLLGALIDEPQPIRLARLGDDDRSVGFPDGHPAMDGFLGVPVRVRGAVFGNLYLTEPASGAFTGEDEELLCVLAATAGIAIENARLFDETQRHQRWSAGTAEISAALLSERADDPRALLADRLGAIAGADLVCVVVPGSPETLLVDTARGALADQVRGLVFPASAAVCGRALESGQPFLTYGAAGHPDEVILIGPTMVIPLRTAGRPYGVLTASRRAGRPGFSPGELEMAADFVGQAGVALELARGRAVRQRLAVLEDRSRIARDLHDQVIQRLFAAGLGLQAIARTVVEPDLRYRILAQVDALDDAIAEIRTAIFALSAQIHPDRPSVRHRILDLLAELGPLFEHPPRITFSGPIDLLTPDALADDLVAVLREGLTNVLRHAGARESTVSVGVAGDTITVDIVDDGVGPAGAVTSSGLANLAERARRWHGALALTGIDAGGCLLRWSARLTGEREGPAQ